MLKKIAWLSLAAVLFAPAVPVLAAGRPGNPHGGQFANKHPRRNQVNNRVARQRRQINREQRSGQITAAQAHQDRQNLNQMKAQEHADVQANGGHLTKGEQQQFNQDLNANHQQIQGQ